MTTSPPQVLHRIAGVAASTATVSSVMDTTEGWAAGVQLTAISLRHQDDPELFAQRLAGSDRLISDYLSEEVLVAQTEARRDVLLRLSALDRMTPALVESVLGIPDAAELFDELERDSMFLVPIDDHHEWFRFHHLFRDLLRYRLRARYPDDEVRSSSAPPDWFVEHGDVPSAIECFLHARAWERAMDLILSRGREVFERGQATSVAQWLGGIPETERIARPEADALYGIVLGMSGQAALQRGRPAATPGAPGRRVPASGLIAHAYLAARVQFRPQVDRVDRGGARIDQDAAGPTPTSSRRTCIGLTDRTPARDAHTGLARPGAPARRRSARSAPRPPAVPGDPRARSTRSTGSTCSERQALLEAWSGRLVIAQKLADEALQLARDVGLLVHPAPADAYLALSLVAIHRGRPQAASFARHEGAVRAASNRRHSAHVDRAPPA